MGQSQVRNCADRTACNYGENLKTQLREIRKERLGVVILLHPVAKLIHFDLDRFSGPLRGIIWFTVAIAGCCAIIALLAGYVQKAKSSEKVSQRVKAVAL